MYNSGEGAIMETNREEKLIIAKLNDKLQSCKTRNKITYTDFLNLNEKNIIQKELERQKNNLLVKKITFIALIIVLC